MRRGPRIKGLLTTGVNLFLLRRTSARICLFLAALSLFPAATLNAEKISDIHPQGYVTDLAGVIDEETKARIEALCTEVEQKTGAQIAVVTVKSLNDQPIENYAHDLFKAMGIGDKKDRRGLLILLSPSEHQYRIEVGRGLEPVIVDARAGDIGRSMVPLLHQGDTSGAIEQAVGQAAQIIAADRGVTLTGLPKNENRGTARVGIGIFKLIFFAIVAVECICIAATSFLAAVAYHSFSLAPHDFAARYAMASLFLGAAEVCIAASPWCPRSSIAAILPASIATRSPAAMRSWRNVVCGSSAPALISRRAWSVWRGSSPRRRCATIWCGR